MTWTIGLGFVRPSWLLEACGRWLGYTAAFASPLSAYPGCRGVVTEQLSRSRVVAYGLRRSVGTVKHFMFSFAHWELRRVVGCHSFTLDSALTLDGRSARSVFLGESKGILLFPSRHCIPLLPNKDLVISLIKTSPSCLSTAPTARAHPPFKYSFWSAGGLEEIRRQSSSPFLPLLNVKLLLLSQTTTYSKSMSILLPPISSVDSVQPFCCLQPAEAGFNSVFRLDYLLCLLVSW